MFKSQKNWETQSWKCSKTNSKAWDSSYHIESPYAQRHGSFPGGDPSQELQPKLQLIQEIPKDPTTASKELQVPRWRSVFIIPPDWADVFKTKTSSGQTVLSENILTFGKILCGLMRLSCSKTWKNCCGKWTHEFWCLPKNNRRHRGMTSAFVTFSQSARPSQGAWKPSNVAELQQFCKGHNLNLLFLWYPWQTFQLVWCSETFKCKKTCKKNP